MITVPTLQAIAALVIGLFLLQLARRLSAQSTNPLAVGVHDGLNFLVGS